MELTIQKILDEHRTNAVMHNVVSMGVVKGKYLFNRQDFEDFWSIYTKTIENPSFNLGIAEKPQQCGLPVLGDIDIKVRESDDIEIGESIHTDKHVIDTIEIYQNVLRRIVDGCTDEHLLCVLLEKPLYRINNHGVSYAKHGFHIHFPYCFLSREDQEIHLIPRVKNMVTESKIFEDIGFEDSGKLIDSSYTKNPWLLYGSRKDVGMDPYTISKVFDSDCKEVDFEKTFRNYEIFDVHEKVIKIKGKVRDYLPRILSIIPHNRRISEVKHGLISPLKEKEKIERKQNDSKKEFKKTTVTEGLEIAERLLPMLCDYRAENYNEWIGIGWILYNIGDGCEQARDMWCKFSSRCTSQYDEAVCLHMWEKMVKKDVGIGSLRYYAKLDSPEKYRELVSERSEKHITESLCGSHNDIAKALYEEYGDEFVCASVSNRVWFQFVGNRWEQIEEGVFLRKKISDEFGPRYTEIGAKLLSNNVTCHDKPHEAMNNARVKMVQKMISNMKSAPFKKNVMCECLEVFYNKKFRDKLDNNPTLFPFNNGVYDLNLNIFRPCSPEDFISKTAPINYNQNLDENDDKVHSVYSFLEKVFPDKSIRQYFLDISSDIFLGGNHQKHVYFWTGEGDNGKSVTQTMFDKMLGPLAIKFNTTVLTGKKVQSGSANPELARAGGGVRLATLEEPNSDEQINIGILKNLSGNDTYYARDLFERGKEGREICPMFKLFFVCLSGDTSVALTSGISVSIKKMVENHRLLSWDKETDGLLGINQQQFLDKGKQECIRLTLLDGRAITCTPDHKFLTSNNEWIEAKHIKIHDTNLKMGIDYPKCDDIFESCTYRFTFGDVEYNLSNHIDRLKASALCRLFGYCANDKKILVSHHIDTENLVEDIRLLTNKTPEVEKVYDMFGIIIPTEVNQPANIPYFIFDDDCPVFMIREFLAGMFGNDGIIPEMRNSVCIAPMLQLTRQKNQQCAQSFHNIFIKLSELLSKRFSIKSTVISEPNLSFANDCNVSLKIYEINDLLTFVEKIGVRYSCHKSLRLTTIGSILRYKNNVKVQNQTVLNRICMKINKDTGEELGDIINESIKEISVELGFSDPDSVITHATIRSYCSSNKCELPSIDVEKYLEKTKLNNYQNIEQTIPCYQMTVINIQNVGEEHVYDLNVDVPYSNFVAEGTIVHNCNKLPKLKYSDKAVWNRIRVIPFESVFCKPNDPAPETYEEQLKQKRFPMDKNFGQKIPKIVEAFAWLLLKHRANIKERIEPEKVRMATAMYRKQNDSYRQFIEECVIEEKGGTINLIELYTQFKDWFKDSLPNHSIPIKNEVEEYFTKIWDEPEKGKKWIGRRLKTLQDDIDAGNVVLLGEEDLVNYDETANFHPL